jgi:hypothetical protein
VPQNGSKASGAFERKTDGFFHLVALELSRRRFETPCKGSPTRRG